MDTQTTMLAALEIALPYVERVAATAPTQPAAVARQRTAIKDAAAIRAAIASVNGTGTTAGEDRSELVGKLFSVTRSLKQNKLPKGLGMDTRIRAARFADRAAMTLKPANLAGPSELQRMIAEGLEIMADVKARVPAWRETA